MNAEIIYNCPEKEYNGKKEIINGTNEIYLFKTLFVRNEIKRYCYACTYSFTDERLKFDYNIWLKNLSINDLRILKNY